MTKSQSQNSFGVKSQSRKSTGSSSPRIKHAVRKVSQSNLLAELKGCSSKISTGKSSTGKRNLNDLMTDIKQEVNHNRQITTKKRKVVDLPNENSSNVPHLNRNCQEEAAHIGTISCEQKERMPPVKSVASDVGLPFEKISPLWKTLESTSEVFRLIPQMPHFTKLESECKETREGMAIGMMVTYANLAESIPKLSIHTEVIVFEEKIGCLDWLEENGFIVGPIRSCLLHLLEIKTKHTKSALKRVELENALANKEQDNISLVASANAYEVRLADVRKSIAELKEKERNIMEERAGILSLTAELQHNISRMKGEISSIDRSYELGLKEFERLTSKHLY